MTTKEIKGTYTKEYIQHKLMTDIRWVERSLVRLYQLQTMEEQQTKETYYENGVGFNSSDSRYLTYCSQWVMRGNNLSNQHVEKCTKKLLKYWKQIQGFLIERHS
jgi:hypothetical protein